MTDRLADVEHSLRIAKVQLMRTVRAEEESTLGAHERLCLFSEIFDEIVSRIELLTLARHALLLLTRVRKCENRLQ